MSTARPRLRRGHERLELVDDLGRQERRPSSRSPPRSTSRAFGISSGRRRERSAPSQLAANEDERRHLDRGQHLAQVALEERLVELVADLGAGSDAAASSRTRAGRPRCEERRADGREQLVASTACVPHIAAAGRARAPARVGSCVAAPYGGNWKRTSASGPLGVGRRKEHGHAAALVRAEDDRAVRPDGVEHGAHVVHPRLQRREVLAAVGEAGSALVEEDHAGTSAPAARRTRRQ